MREDEARGGEQAGMYEAVAGGEGGSWGGHFAGGCRVWRGAASGLGAAARHISSGRLSASRAGDRAE